MVKEKGQKDRQWSIQQNTRLNSTNRCSLKWLDVHLLFCDHEPEKINDHPNVPGLIYRVSEWLLFKEILSTKIVIFSYPKLLSFSVLTFIRWRLTPSYAAKDTIFWQKRPKTIVIRIIVLDDNIQIYLYGLLCEPVLSMRTV